jgi:hypothetical protein
MVAACATGIPAAYTYSRLGIMNAKRELLPIINIFVTFSDVKSTNYLLRSNRTVKHKKPTRLHPIANCIDVAFLLLRSVNRITPITIVKPLNMSSS